MYHAAVFCNLLGDAMTDTQFLTVLGTIWIAPYVNKWFAQIFGLVFLSIVIFKSLGKL